MKFFRTYLCKFDRNVWCYINVQLFFHQLPYTVFLCYECIVMFVLILATVLLAVDTFKDKEKIVPFRCNISATIHEKGPKMPKLLKLIFPSEPRLNFKYFLPVFRKTPRFWGNKCYLDQYCQIFCCQWNVFVAALLDLVPMATQMNGRG